MMMIKQRCAVQVDGKQETLDILDTAGQEQFAALQHHWIRESHAFLLVYAVNSDRTFKHTNDLHKTILRNKDGERIDMVLVGNKADLPDNQVCLAITISVSVLTVRFGFVCSIR